MIEQVEHVYVLYRCMCVCVCDARVCVCDVHGDSLCGMLSNVVICSLLLHGLLSGEDEGHDQAVEPQHLGEDQDEDHAHEEPRLLGGAPHAGVAHDADGKAGRQATQTHAQASAQVKETPARWVKGEQTTLKLEGKDPCASPGFTPCTFSCGAQAGHCSLTSAPPHWSHFTNSGFITYVLDEYQYRSIHFYSAPLCVWG